MLKIKIKYFVHDMPKIEKIDIGDWIDLRAARNISLCEREHCLIPLGVAMKLPEKYEAHLAARSSTFKHWGILQTNPPSVIDESYCGDNDQWFFSVVAMRDTAIQKGDRICHFRIVSKMPKVAFMEVEHLGNPDRGGFGSTGKNKITQKFTEK